MVLFCSLEPFSFDECDEYGSALLSSPGAESPHFPPYSELINHPSCVLGFHLNPMFTLPVSKLFFLSQVCDWVSKFQNLGTPQGAILCFFLWGSSHPAFAICRLVTGKRLHDCAVVGSLWQYREESRHQDLLSSVDFLTPMPENSEACWHRPLFLQPRGSSDHLSLLGFLPTSLSEHL